MEHCVYMVVDEGAEIRRILTDHGYRLIVGKGQLEDEPLAVADAIIPGKAYITDDVLRKAPKVRIISKFGVGVDRIDIPACTTHGVYVTNTPGSNALSVAEHTVMLLLAAAKKILPITYALRHEAPDWAAAKRNQGQELWGKTISIIGFGNIGRRVARLLSVFGMNILAYDPYVCDSDIPDYVELTRDLDFALSQGDFISIHAAGSDSTQHLISNREFSLMKSSAIILNTTRGFVVDEAALISALQNGIIAGAALDVLSEEPVQADNPLLSMENVIITPHNAGNTPEARLRAQIICAENIVDCLNGRRPTYALNSLVHTRKE